jgi:PII-like signaling protein
MKHVILRIYLSEKDSYRGKAAYHAVIEFFKEAGIAGATVHHCLEGYGVDHIIHTANVLRLGADLPIIVQAVDTEDNIRNIIPQLRQMLPRELMILQEVEVIPPSQVKNS